MGLILLKRVSLQVREHGLAECLLFPDLPSALLYGPHYTAIQLANLWRLRRERPYVVASIDEDALPGTLEEADLRYICSLPQLAFEGRPAARSARYVGQGDISPLTPRDEEDFLLLLPQPPPRELPPWPGLVTDLNAVLFSQVDEFTKLHTVDRSVTSLIEALPVADLREHQRGHT